MLGGRSFQLTQIVRKPYKRSLQSNCLKYNLCELYLRPLKRPRFLDGRDDVVLPRVIAWWVDLSGQTGLLDDSGV